MEFVKEGAKKGKKKRKKEKVAEGLRRREAPAKARSGGLFDPLRYSGTGKLCQVADFPSLKMMHFCFIVPNKCCVSFKCLKKHAPPAENEYWKCVKSQ